MQSPSPENSSSPKRFFNGFGTFSLGFLLPIILVLLIKPLLIIAGWLGVVTLISAVLAPVFSLGMLLVAAVLLVLGLAAAILALTFCRMRPIPSFFIGLALSLWAFGLYCGLWYVIAYKGRG